MSATQSQAQLRDFQIEGANFLAFRRHAMLLDDAGLGKSAQAIRACEAVGAKHVLILGPAVAGVSWPKEIKQFAGSHRRFHRLDAKTLIAKPADDTFYFCSYDLLSLKTNGHLKRTLSNIQWDVVVLDEAQYLKNEGANRTQAVYGPKGVIRQAKRVWVLSGSITPNHNGELYTHMARLFPAALGGPSVPSRIEFEDRFCVVRDTTYGRVIDGNTNSPALRNSLEPFVLRRLKSDVLKELPPMDFLVAPLDVDPKAVEAIYQTAINAAPATPAGFQIATGLSTLDAGNLEAFMRAIFPNGSTHRRQLGILKTEACAEWARNFLETSDKKLVVFAYHKDVIKELTRLLADYNPIVFTGETSAPDRVVAVDNFQKLPGRRLFIGHLIAAGTAITLTAASTSFFAEFSGVPGTNYQAASRLHRMGQHDGVQAFFGTVMGSIDNHIAQVSARRARDIGELLG